MPSIEDIKKCVHHLKGETFALYLAARHPGTPWYAKAFVAGIVAYALSPIDLIPDFIPVLGFLKCTKTTVVCRTRCAAKSLHS